MREVYGWRRAGGYRVSALVLGVATLGCIVVAPARAAIPQYAVSEVRAPDPQSQPGMPNASGFGERLRTLGDVNGDGARDVLVSNHNFDRNGLGDVGRLWIFSGRTGALLRTIDHPAPQAGAQFGFWSAAPGDVSGDRVPDFATSASRQAVGGTTRQGQVYVFSGASGALLRTIDHPDAPQASGDFGGNMIAPGDLNGDRVGDFVATASGTAGGSGAAYALSGATGSLLYRVSNPDTVQLSSFGFGASETGDVNGDGVSDYQVAAPRHDVGAVVDVGRSYTVNGRTGAVIHTLENPDVESMARFGQADVDGQAVGDVTGDRVPDVYVNGFLSDDGALSNAGAAYLFSGATGQPIRRLRDPMPVMNGQFGASNASAGDIDRDGRPDQLVSSRGVVGRVIIFGGTGLADVLGAFDDPRGQQDALFGSSIASLGDVNGDRSPDFFISARSADLDGAANVGIVYAFISRPPPFYVLPRLQPSPPGAGISRVRPSALRPRVTRAVQRDGEGRIRVTVKGRLTRTRGRGCAGRVMVRIRVGRRSVRVVRARMGSRCRFTKSTRVRVGSLPRRLRPHSGRVVLRVSYRFLGNRGLLPASSPTARKRVTR